MIHLQAFARYRELLGFDRLELPLPEPPALGALLAHPALAALPSDALLAVNQTFAGRDTALKDGDDVALLPPVSGG
jgi:molybdopterin converting factor small subunit